MTRREDDERWSEERERSKTHDHVLRHASPRVTSHVAPTHGDMRHRASRTRIRVNLTYFRPDFFGAQSVPYFLKTGSVYLRSMPSICFVSAQTRRAIGQSFVSRC